MGTLDEGVSHIRGWTGRDSARCRQAAQNGERLAADDALFISRLFHSRFLDHGRPRLTETSQTETRAWRAAVVTYLSADH